MESASLKSEAPIKRHIKGIVKAYEMANPHEVTIMKKVMQMRRAMAADQKFATVKGTDLRGLYEIPETLHNLFTSDLELYELTWLKTRKAGQWFAKTFPLYSLTNNV